MTTFKAILAEKTEERRKSDLENLANYIIDANKNIKDIRIRANKAVVKQEELIKKAQELAEQIEKDGNYQDDEIYEIYLNTR